MLISELQEIISRKHREDNINVKVVIKTPTGGPSTPAVHIKSAQFGFDWDSNTLLLYPEQDLSYTDHDHLANIKKQAEEIGWSVYEMGNLKREIKSLRKKLKELENGQP